LQKSSKTNTQNNVLELRYFQHSKVNMLRAQYPLCNFAKTCVRGGIGLLAKKAVEI